MHDSHLQKEGVHACIPWRGRAKAGSRGTGERMVLQTLLRIVQPQAMRAILLRLIDPDNDEWSG